MPETPYVCAIGGERLPRGDAFYCECGAHDEDQWYCIDEMRQCDSCRQYYTEDHWPDPCCEDPDDEDDDDSIAHILQSYSYKPDWVFSRQSDENTNIYLGVELEFEAHSTGEIGNLVESTSSRLVLWKADGSLIRGAELVTHPASLRYHLEEFDWNGLLEQVADADLYVAPSCGMHIHASKPSNYRQMNRLMTMLIDYEKELCGVSLRHQHDLDRWARWNSHGWETSKQETQNKYETWLQLMRHCRNRGRYVALNVGPPDTVEFRFFAGSEDHEQVLARLSLVDHMMQISKARHELPDWTQFLKGIDTSMASKLERDITDNQNSYMLSPYNQDSGRAGYAGPEAEELTNHQFPF